DSQLSWNTTSPKLTACIAETAFTWIPGIFLAICLPVIITDVFRSRRPSIPWNAYNGSRLIIALTLSVFHFDDKPSMAYLISTAVYSIISVVLCLVLYCHQLSGIHCSGIVWFYLLMDAVFKTLSVATYSMNRDIRQTHEYTLFLIQYSLTIILFLMNSSADRLPVGHYSDKLGGKSRVCPKERVSFPQKLIFEWVTRLIVKGWKSPLTTDDLWDVRREDRCKRVFGEFNAIWKGTKYTADAEDEKVVTELSGKGGDIKYQSIKDLSESSSQSQQKSTPNAPQNNRLLKVIGKGFWFYFLIPSILKLVADVVQLANPMIMKLLIGFTTDADEPSWHGYMYAILLIFTNIFQSLINGYQAQRMSVLGMRIRTCLVSAVYRKSLVLSNHSKKDTTSGEIVNLMAVDSQRFVDMLPYLSFLWTAPVQIAISLYLLYNEMGLATLGGLVVMLLLIPVNGWVSTKIRTIQSKQMKLKDQRVRNLNEILSGIKVLKLYGWEEAFVKNVLDIRKRELRLIWKSGLISGVTVVLAGTTPLLVALVTFGLYIGLDSDNKLDAQKAFVSIALFNLLRIPLTIVPNMVTSLIMTLVSVKRLNKFLNFSELS
ncbi:unnamed protein product, partial [Oppiella nova]